MKDIGGRRRGTACTSGTHWAPRSVGAAACLAGVIAGVIGWSAVSSASATTRVSSTPPVSVTPSTDVTARTAGVPLDSIPGVPVTVVDVKFSDFAFEIQPEIPAGLVMFNATNSGTEEHHLTLIKVPDGSTFEEVLGRLPAMETDPTTAVAGLDLYPGPNGVAPGGEGAVLVNMTPGEYVALCVISSPDGVVHALKGMLTKLTVTGPEMPVPEIGAPVITLSDYSFDIPDGFNGHGIYEIKNTALQPHEVVFYKVPDGTTRDQVLGLLESDRASVIPAGGVTVFTSPQSAWIEFDFVPGTYALLCFMPDGADAQPHTAHGMVDVITVP